MPIPTDDRRPSHAARSRAVGGQDGAVIVHLRPTTLHDDTTLVGGGA